MAPTGDRLTLTEVVLLERGSDATDVPVWTQEHAADGLAALWRRGFTLHRDPAGALVRLAKIVSQVHVSRLQLGSAARTTELIQDHVADGPS